MLTSQTYLRREAGDIVLVTSSNILRLNRAAAEFIEVLLGLREGAESSPADVERLKDELLQAGMIQPREGKEPYALKEVGHVKAKGRARHSSDT